MHYVPEAHLNIMWQKEELSDGVLQAGESCGQSCLPFSSTLKTGGKIV